MAQHTPGPWEVGKGSPRLVHNGPRWVAGAIGHDEEAEANARLISLAPDMADYIRRAASNCAEANELLKRIEG